MKVPLLRRHRALGSLCWLFFLGLLNTSASTAERSSLDSTENQLVRQVQDERSPTAPSEIAELSIGNDELLLPKYNDVIDTGPNCTEWNADNRLECWLWQLEVPIPDESFTQDWITIHIRDLVCTQFVLQDLESQYKPLHTLDMALRNLQTTCKGSYHATGGLSGHVQASVTQASIQTTSSRRKSSHPPALQVEFRLTADPSSKHKFPIPFKLQTTDCQTHLKAHIHFTGSTSARLIQLFSKTIAGYITQALQEQICPLLPKQLDPLASKYIQKLDDWMEPYLSDSMRRTPSRNVSLSSPVVELPRLRRLSSTDIIPRIPTISDSNETTTSNPAQWKVIHWALETINRQLQDHLQDGWLLNTNNTQGCPKKCKNTFRGFSGWFRSLMGAQVAIPLPPIAHHIPLPPLPLGVKASLELERITVEGLDLLDSLQVGNPQNETFESHVATSKGLVIEAEILLHLQMSDAEHALDEPFSVTFNLTQLETTLTTQLSVLDWERTSLLQVVNAVQNFVDDPTPARIRETLGCLIRTIDQVDNMEWLTHLVFESIQVKRRGGQASSIEDNLDAVINSILELLLKEYGILWTTLVQGLSRDPARHAVNHLLSQWLDQHATTDACPAAPTSDKPKWLNFTKFLVLDQLNDFLNRSTTKRSLSDYLECVGDFLQGLDSNSTTDDIVTLRTIETKDWDSVQGLQIFQPTDDTSLQSSIQWGTETKVPQLDLVLQVQTAEVNGEVNLTFFAGFEAVVGIHMDYDLNRFQNLTVAHVLQQGQCGILPMVELGLIPNSTAVNLGPSVGMNVSALLNDQSIIFSTWDKDKEKVPESAAQFLEWSVESFRALVNQALEDWVQQNSEICPGVVPNDHDDDHHGDNGGNDSRNTKPWLEYPFFWIFLVAVILGQAGTVSIARPPATLDRANLDRFNEDQPNNELREPLLSNATEETILNPAPLEENMGDLVLTNIHQMDQDVLNDIRDDMREEESGFVLEEHAFEEDGMVKDKALMSSTRLSEPMRFTLPILVVGTIALLFASNVSVGASVNLFIHANGSSIPIPGLFEFSLGNTIVELYKAGIYPLLFLVTVFSGIWPYAKLLWMLQLWLSPFQNAHKREERLLTLDALSKFSLVDTYVLVIFLVAFRFHLEISGGLGVDVYVNPDFGFYAFLLATCLSLLIGHGMLFFHRRTQFVRAFDVVPVEEIIDVGCIFDHEFKVEKDGGKRRLSKFSKMALFVTATSALSFMVLGFGMKSFEFSFGGLAGLALGKRSHKSYSLVSIGAAIPQGVSDPSSFGIRCLQLAYYFYAVITPLACLLLLLALFLYPMTLRMQRKLLVAAEIANAWGAVEVFLLSIVAALFQISTFASFIIGDKCDVINQIAATLIGDNVIPSSDAVCFNVTASVAGNCWYLIVGVLLNSFVVSVGLRLAHTAVEERSYQVSPPSDTVTLPHRMYAVPILGKLLLFSGRPHVEAEESAQVDAEGESNEDADEETESPEWRHWF